MFAVLHGCKTNALGRILREHWISAIFSGVRILHLKFTFACSKWQGGEYVPRDYNSLSAKWYCMDHKSKTPLNSYESTLVKIKIIRIDDTIASIRTACLFRIIPIEVSICIFIQLTWLKPIIEDGEPLYSPVPNLVSQSRTQVFRDTAARKWKDGITENYF